MNLFDGPTINVDTPLGVKVACDKLKLLGEPIISIDAETFGPMLQCVVQIYLTPKVGSHTMTEEEAALVYGRQLLKFIKTKGTQNE